MSLGCFGKYLSMQAVHITLLTVLIVKTFSCWQLNCGMAFPYAEINAHLCHEISHNILSSIQPQEIKLNDYAEPSFNIPGGKSFALYATFDSG